MRDEVIEWFDQAEYDVDTAEAMFDAGRYIYCVYMCHLAVEKALKALVVKHTEEMPPRTHNLIFLLKISNAKLSKLGEKYLAVLNTASVATRYPDQLHMMIEKYPPEIAGDYLKKAREVIQCLKEQMM